MTIKESDPRYIAGVSEVDDDMSDEEWVEAMGPAPEPTERWHIVLTDYGSLSGEIEWHSRTITDAAWHIYQAWGRFHELPESDDVIMLSDSLIARVYDTKKDTEAPAYELMPHTKRDAIVRRRPKF